MTKTERHAKLAAHGAGVPTEPVREKKSPRAAPCLSLGSATGDVVSCSSCAGTVQLKTFACSVHGACTPQKPVAGTACCATCDDYARFPAPTVRHLLYHVYPRRGSRWRERVLRLRERIELFNGRRVVAVAADDTTDAASDVSQALAECGCEVLSFPNEPSLREVATFLPLFDRVADLTGPEHATLYAHAKGVTRPPLATCHRWADVLEDVLMGHWPAVAKVLTQHSVAGCFKKVGRGWPARESASEWHYSGSFCWYRNAELFAKPDWRRIDKFWAGIEPYPSLHFGAHEAGCVFHADAVEGMNLYDPAVWQSVVEPEYQKWLSSTVSCAARRT